MTCFPLTRLRHQQGAGIGAHMNRPLTNVTNLEGRARSRKRFLTPFLLFETGKGGLESEPALRAGVIRQRSIPRPQREFAACVPRRLSENGVGPSVIVYAVPFGVANWFNSGRPGRSEGAQTRLRRRSQIQQTLDGDIVVEDLRSLFARSSVEQALDLLPDVADLHFGAFHLVGS